MRITEIIALIEAAAPPATAEAWDNVGLQVGNPDAETNGCLLALDVTPETIREARQCGAGLVIAHHPLIFAPLASVTEQTPVGATILAAARGNVAVYVAHTNLDAAPAVGTAAALAEALGLPFGPVLAPVEGGEHPGGEIPSPRGIGMIVEVPALKLAALAEYVEGKLARTVSLVGDGERLVRFAALVPGSGGSLVEQAAAGADVMITGEIKYHEALDAAALGLGVIAAGHYDTERPVLNVLARHLKEATAGALQVGISQIRSDPFWTLPPAGRPR
jgi:dinuclear metal center YbgI/SA1388 family protein